MSDIIVRLPLVARHEPEDSFDSFTCPCQSQLRFSQLAVECSIFNKIQNVCGDSGRDGAE